jgi:branched-chain amino acid transport system ATP-binding protein
VNGLTKRYGGLTANADIAFDVNEGEIVGIIGPNGAGKSTLFDLITGFQPPSAGFASSWTAATSPGCGPTASAAWASPALSEAQTLSRPHGHGKRHGRSARPHLGPENRARAGARVARRRGPAGKAQSFARELSTGQRKRLELARGARHEPATHPHGRGDGRPSTSPTSPD